MMKHRKNKETLWKIEKKQWNITKNRETRINNDEKREKKQWEMMKKRGKKQWKMMKHREKRMKNDEK